MVMIGELLGSAKFPAGTPWNRAKRQSPSDELASLCGVPLRVILPSDILSSCVRSKEQVTIFREGRIMSEISTAVTADHFRYLAERTTREDDFLLRLKAQARTSGIPPIWISPEEGSFLQLLLKAVKAKRVIEIGTLAGYSAIWMARALPADGQVRTIETSARHADFAEQWIAKSDVAQRIKVYRGRGEDILPEFDADSADAAFIDADKEGYPLFLRESLRIVRRGGLIMADNAFGFGRILDRTDSASAPMRAFNDLMVNERTLQSIIVPFGDGVWFGLKL
jgi:predicted O-methyltransferase YrrM